MKPTTIKSLADVKLDPLNANAGNAEGRAMIAASLQRYMDATGKEPVQL